MKKTITLKSIFTLLSIISIHAMLIAQNINLVKDINPSTASSNPTYLTNFNNSLFFNADDGVHGPELWKSDGTPAGTALYNDIIAGATGSNPYIITAQKNHLYFFTGADGSDSLRLWKTNGTDGTVALVKSFFTNNYGNDAGFGAYGADNLLYFFIYNFAAQQQALWRSDGTGQGTFLLKDSFSLQAAGNPVAISGNNIFIGDETDTSARLWTSDGSVAGTVVVKSFLQGIFYEISNLYPYNGDVFFNADNGSGTRFWKSDGTEAGTVIVKDLFRAGSTYAVSNGVLFFDADDNSGIGRQLWKTDGTEAGTVLVRQIGTYGSSPQMLTDVNGTLYFVANANDYTPTDTGRGNELYKSDGTPAGTQLVKDITPGSASTGFSGPFVNGNGKLFFTIYDASFNSVLWQSDGTEAGTNAVQDAGLTGVTNIANLTSVAGQLFFQGTSDLYGSELYAGNPGALPLSLLNFSGEAQDRDNILHWVTAFEQNNSGFEIQRSIDKNNFTKIGFINTRALYGNSNINLSYSFKDASYSALTNYYRLKEIGMSGRAAYSNIVTLTNKNLPLLQAAVINPNISSEEFTLYTNNTDPVSVAVFGLSGKPVLHFDNVTSSLQFGKTLSAGVYVVQLIQGTEKKEIKIVKAQ